MRLTHPSIVKTYSLEQRDGFLVIVQQFIDGCDLREYAKKPLSRTEIVEIIASVADGLGMRPPILEVLSGDMVVPRTLLAIKACGSQQVSLYRLLRLYLMYQEKQSEKMQRLINWICKIEWRWQAWRSCAW